MLRSALPLYIRVMIWSTPTAKSSVKVLGNKRYLGFLLFTISAWRTPCKS
nr:MAG TPA: hypothetical protein [Caudoviricetes sp.]